MKPNVLVYTLFWGILLAGCDSLKQEVEPKGISRQPEKLVVACFISPQDTVLAARVTRTSPVLGVGSQYNPDISNATVTLSDGGRSVLLQSRFDPNGGYGFSRLYYRANATELPIIVGKTYTLTVRVPDGRQVTATCTVPEPVTLQSVVLYSAVTNEFGRSRKEYYARLRWRDPAGRPNYYRVAGDSEYSYTSQIRTSATSPVRDTTIRMRGNWYFNNGWITTDLDRDGQEFVSGRGRLPIAYSWVNGQQQTSRPTGQANAYLLNVDENYYLYHDAFGRQIEVGDNPFAEPVPILTNIQGGLGCFGAYNKAVMTMDLKLGRRELCCASPPPFLLFLNRLIIHHFGLLPNRFHVDDFVDLFHQFGVQT